MAETDLERRKRLAAEEDDFTAYRRALREEQAFADRSGGLINGRPAAEMVNAEQVEVIPAPGNRYSDRQRVFENANRLRQERMAQPDKSAARGDAFLESVGVNPNSIGTATVSEEGRLLVPSIAQEQLAQRANNQYQAERNNLRIAANQLRRRRDYQGAAALRQQADIMYPQIGGRSYENRMNYWLARTNPASISRQYGLPANGFGPVDIDTDSANARYGAWS